MSSDSLHPLFLEAAEYVSDSFWKDTLTACAHNKFPKGVRYDPKGNSLSVRVIIGNKTSSDITAISTNPEKACFEVIELFKEKLTLYSPYDLQIKKDEVAKLQEEYVKSITCDWKKLKPRSIKDAMIETFVVELAEKHDATLKETRYIKDTLILAFQFKGVLPDDVVYENCKIQEIKGFSFDPKTRKCKLARTISYTAKKEKKQESQKFDQLLTNYTKSVKNRGVK